MAFMKTEVRNPVTWHQFVATLVLPLCLLVASFGIIFPHIHEKISITQQEMIGVRQVRGLDEIIQIMQQIRGLMQIAWERGEATTEQNVVALHGDLKDAVEAFQHAFPVVGPLFVQELRVMVAAFDRHLLTERFAAGGAVALFDLHTAHISRVKDEVRAIATRFNLILDGEFTTHIMIELLIRDLPGLVESMGRTRGMGSGLLAQESVQALDRHRFVETLGHFRSNLDQTMRSQELAVQSKPVLAKTFICFSETLQPSARRFLRLSEAVADANSRGVTSHAFFATGTHSIASVTRCTTLLHESLLTQLNRRMQRLVDDKNMMIVGIVLTMVVMVTVLTLYHLRNRRVYVALDASEVRSRAMMETAVDGILMMDEEGSIRAANHALDNMFGYYPGELIGKNVSVLIPLPHREGDGDDIEYPLGSICSQVEGVVCEVAGICRDGGHFPLEFSASRFCVNGDVFFAAILRDITERKQAKDALEKSYTELEDRVQERTQELERLAIKLGAEVEEHQKAQTGLMLASKVFENASEAIVVTDSRARIVDVNPAFTRITGFKRGEVLGKNPGVTKSGRHGPEFYAKMWRDILGEGSWRGEIWDRHKSGKVYPKWLTINAIEDALGGVAYFIGIFSDISQIKATEKRLEKLAFYDPLTHLPNRMLFQDRLNHEIQVAQRTGTRVAACFIDLDRFKHVNDTLGHAAGDTLLVEVAKRLKGCVRQTDTVSRLGGDEFTLILPAIEHAQQCAAVADNIIRSLQRTFDLDGEEAYIGASIGIAFFPEDGDDFTTLTKNADVAMYRAKEAGRGVFRFFEPSMNTVSNTRFTLEAKLRRAVDQQAFTLFYQPKFHLSHRGPVLTGMEALIRWPQNDGTMVAPSAFIPLAEETGLIEPLGVWILNEACRQTQRWNDAGHPPLKVAVNLSARQFQHKTLHATIAQALASTRLDATYLEIEVTESMVMGNHERVSSVLEGLRDMGVTISLDDFGTGYSSLSHLKQFPIHTLKIDRSFVRDLTANSDDAAIVRAIISMAHDLALNVVAEGVEEAPQLAFLMDHGCDEGQGYFFSKPLSSDAFGRWRSQLAVEA